MNGFETIRFNDGDVDLGGKSITEFHDVAGSPRYLTGANTGTDRFVIDGNSSDYGWGDTLDGSGTVVWIGDKFDVLNDFEEIEFNDRIVDISSDDGGLA